MTQAQRDIRRKLQILNYAEEIGNVSKACRYFGISRETFYLWKRAYQERGKEGHINSKPCPENPSLRTPPEIEEKILYLRRTYHLGQLRIAWYLERYHSIKISGGGVYGVLRRHGLNRIICTYRPLPGTMSVSSFIISFHNPSKGCSNCIF
jgi:transposase